MSRLLVGVFGLAIAVPGTASACLPPLSDEFPTALHAVGADRLPPAGISARLQLIQFHGGSCEGVQFAALAISGLSRRNYRHVGYFVRPVSGFNGGGIVPGPRALAPLQFENGVVRVTWAGADIVPDADGHVRWRLEVTPVSRSGARGRLFEVCAATDGSCPPLVPACDTTCPAPSSP